MATKLKITVTKEILERSKMCGVFTNEISTNCAISLAVRDIWPYACVEEKGIFIHPMNKPNRFWKGIFDIYLPKEASEFIIEFDHAAPEDRPLLPELTFEIEIPEEIIDQINIDELKPLLENHPTLQLV